MIINSSIPLRITLGGLIITLIVLSGMACAGSSEAPVVESEAPGEVTETPLPPLGATASPAEGAIQAVPLSEAEISSVDVLILESFPVQVNAMIQGMLPDGCTSIDRIEQQRNDTNFMILVTTARLTTALCMEQRQPFEESVPLDAAGLAAGSYTVAVSGKNQMNGSFELSVDNALPEGEAPASGETSISGIIWEDTCQLSPDGTPSAGCVAGEEGGYRADGVFDSAEARLAGVEVSLAPGECPGGELLLTATSDESGSYVFNNVEPGVYCAFIEPTVEPNASLLLPGSWTYPALEVGALTVVVGAGQTQTADFGWNAQLDVPEETEPELVCNDQAAFIADVTIPDDTILMPGASFVKTWRVRNDGDCPWTTGYRFAFAGGDQMGGPPAVPLPQVVEPGAEVDLSVPLVAPSIGGIYRGDWLLQNGAGEVFSSQAEFPFYVQVVVEGGEAAPSQPSEETGSTGATVTGIIWEDNCRILNDGSPSAECVPNGLGGYRANGLLDSGEQPIAAVQVKLSPGDCPGSEAMFATVETNSEGIYRFSGLQAGPHCVSIDASTEPNASTLLPGDWTYPAPGKGWTTIIVGENEIQATDFGWNYHLQ